MRQITLRPDMKTSGGEVCDILLGDKFVGTLIIVYREGDRVSGAAQLDATVLREFEKETVLTFLKDHIYAFGSAVMASYSDVIVTYSPYDQIFSYGDEDEARLHVTSSTYEDEVNEEEDYEDEEEDEWEYELLSDDERDISYELVIVDEEQESAEYQVYDDSGSCVAHINISIQMGSVEGEVDWLLEPEDEAITLITELLAKEFDEDTVERFYIDHRFEGTVIETAEFDGEEQDEDELNDNMLDDSDWQSQDPYHIVLVRDDIDALTYEIFSPLDSSLPIAHATIDIHQRRLSGYIDFRERELVDDAPEIAVYLMRELDKEKDYDGLNLSLMYRNELVDELIIETEMS